MLILDTNILSEVLKPAPEPVVTAWLAAQDPLQTYITAITEAELRYGAATLPKGRRRAALAKAIHAVLEEEFRDRVLPFGGSAPQLYASIAAERRAKGRPISQFDGQIAAIARTAGASLATRNVKDFGGCGVQLICPWEDA